MKKDLSRELSGRHVWMMTIGGAIGTGLFLGSGTAIQQAGPSIMGGYLLAAGFTYLMLRALGELILADPSKGSFIEVVRTYLGPRWEFIVGWTYWLCWESLAMTNLTASGIYMHYWFPHVPQWLIVLIFLIALVAINLTNVGLFARLEAGFASIKVIAILALIAVGIVLLGGHFQVGGQAVALQNLGLHGGFFPHGMKGMLLCLPMVIFAYTGIEMVGLTAGETKTPEKDIPQAINSIGPQISLFYIGALFVLMCIIPWDQVSVTGSPFVQVFGALGIKAAASIINFVVLTAALSSCNSAIFSTSRIIHSLAQNNQAPAYFGQTNQRNVPLRALLLSSGCLLLIVGLNFVLPAAVFTIISGVATVSFIFVWIILLICHIKYRQGQAGSDVMTMPFFPVTNWLTIAFFGAVLVLLLFTPATRLSLFWTIGWFVLIGGASLVFDHKEAVERADW